MRRPMVLVSAGFGAGIGFEFLLRLELFFLLLLLVLAIVFLLWNYKYKRLNGFKGLLSLFFVFFLLGGSLFQLNYQREDRLLELQDSVETLWGTVLTAEKKEDDYYKLTISIKSAQTLGSLDKSSKVLANVFGNLENYSDLPGRKIKITGELSLPQERRNPNAFDYRLYLKTRGINVLMTALPAHMTVSEDCENIIINKLSRLKGDFTQKLYDNMDIESAGIVCGMVFGDKGGIEEDLYESFQRNGTAHILAVSGLHIGIIYACINKLCGGRKNVYIDCGAILLLLGYAALASFTPSVMRAVIMIILHIISKLTYQRYDMLSCGAATAFISLLHSPLLLFNTGFQLSYLAIFSLAVIFPVVKRFHDGLFTSILAIQAGMIPITAYLFNYFSLGAFIANIPILFLGGIMIPLGMFLFAVAALPLPEAVFGMGAGAMEVLAKLLIGSNYIVYSQGRFDFNLVTPDIFFVCFYCGALFFFLSEMAGVQYLRKQYRKLLYAALLITVASGAVSFVCAQRDPLRGADMVFVDVGQGDCLHIKTTDGKNILIDGGGSLNYAVGKKILMPYLLKNGVSFIDIAFVSHLHVDHYQGIADLSKAMKIKKLGLYEGNKVLEDDLRSQTGMAGEDFLYLSKGQKVSLGKDAWVEVIAPKRLSKDEYKKLAEDKEDENASSLILKVYCRGVSVLMTGDIDTVGEGALAEAEGIRLFSDILKVAHHGSKYSSDEGFIENVNPSVAVIQVGKNNFGHPAPSVIEKYRKKGIMVYRNDLHGAIGVFCLGENRAALKTQIKGE